MEGGTGYPYTLEPYKGPDSRHTCPACGAAHKFARYIDNATGQYIADEVGRCDREDSCGYHLKPREYFSQHPDRAGEYKPLKRKSPARVEAYTPPAPPESYTIPARVVRSLYSAEGKAEAGKTGSAHRWPYWPRACSFNVETLAEMIGKSAFASCAASSQLAGYLWNLLGRDAFRKACNLYHLASWRGAAVFWYVDRTGRIRTGKAMYYKDNGHRDKNYNPFYMHGILSGQGFLPEGWHLRRCLFGEHLLKLDAAAPVALVESEKTAIIASALTEGQALWLAAGGLHYLNADSCAGLKGRKVIAYPDLGAFEKWQERLQDLAAKVGFSVILSDCLERCAAPEDRAAGLDIADFLIREIESKTSQQNG